MLTDNGDLLLNVTIIDMHSAVTTNCITLDMFRSIDYCQQNAVVIQRYRRRDSVVMRRGDAPERVIRRLAPSSLLASLSLSTTGQHGDIRNRITTGIVLILTMPEAKLS